MTKISKPYVFWENRWHEVYVMPVEDVPEGERYQCVFKETGVTEAKASSFINALVFCKQAEAGLEELYTNIEVPQLKPVA